MFNTNNYLSILFALLVCVALVAGFAAIQAHFAFESAQQELDQKIEYWKRNEPERYSYTIEQSCGLSWYITHVVKTNGQIAYKSGYEVLTESNIDIIFNDLRNQLGKNYPIKVTYNDLGYPELIQTDYLSDYEDAGCITLISNFNELDIEKL